MSDNTTSVMVDDIVVRDRYREDYGDLEPLIDNIKKYGIISPLAVVDEGGILYLLAGERRLKAAKEAGLDTVPVRIYSNLEPVDKKIIELSENIHRKDMTPHEEASLTLAIHEAHQSKYGKAEKTGTIKESAEQSGWGMTDTATYMGASVAKVSRDIKIAKAAEVIPEIKKAKSKNDALKIFQTKHKEYQTSENAKIIKKKYESRPEDVSKKELIDSYIIKDVFLGLQDIPDNSFDFIEIDPPYAIDLKTAKFLKGASAKTAIEDYGEVSSGEYVEFMKALFKECYRVLKPNRFMICWYALDPWHNMLWRMLRGFGYDEIQLMKGCIEDIEKILEGRVNNLNMYDDISNIIYNYRKSNTAQPKTKTKNRFIGSELPAIWSKGIGQTKNPDKYMGSSYEPFFYVRNSDKAILNKQGRSNVLNFKPINAHHKVHPTERPIEMMEYILETFIPQGSNILVPFAGSGNTGLAASNHKCSVTMFDIVDKYKDSYIHKIAEGTVGNFKSYKE